MYERPPEKTANQKLSGLNLMLFLLFGTAADVIDWVSSNNIGISVCSYIFISLAKFIFWIRDIRTKGIAMNVLFGSSLVTETIPAINYLPASVGFIVGVKIALVVEERAEKALAVVAKGAGAGAAVAGAAGKIPGKRGAQARQASQQMKEVQQKAQEAQKAIEEAKQKEAGAPPGPTENMLPGGSPYAEPEQMKREGSAEEPKNPA